MSLRTKLFLPLGLSVVLLASYVYGFWIPRLLGDADNDFQRSTERHLESVAEGLVPLILGNDLDAIYANLDALLRKNGDWWNIRLFDREGRSLYPIDDSLNAKSDKTEDLRTLVHEISYLGVKLGSVELQADFAQRLNDIRKRCLTLVYTFLAAMLLFFLFTGLLLDRVVRRPIKALADASERLVAGEFEMPLPKPDNGEVGTLLKSFANMREAIRTNSQRLLEGNKQLRREIAERSKVEKALRESERRFRIMADSSPMMLWVSGTDALCTFFNKRWLEFRGRTLEQEEGNGWAEGVHPEDFDRCLETYMSAFERREEFSMEYRLQRFDGEFRWIWDIGVPRFSSDGEFSGYIGSCIDVTERKLAEEAKVRSERIYRQMFEGSRAVKMLIDPETSELIDANPAAEHFYGYAAEDLKRMKISDINILPPEQIFSEMARAKALNKLHFFFKHRLASGEIRDVEVHSSPLDFGDKLILYSIIHDVTERKKAEESADRANRDWERTFNAISDMVMVLDDQYKIIRANKATADAYGMSEQELVGRLCFEIAHGENDPPAFCPHSLLLKDGKEHSIEAWEPRLGCTLDTRVSPVLDDSGAIIGAVHVARDVSERKRAERSISLMNFALDNVREAAFLVDENARFLYVNEEACRVLGYSRAELLTLGVPDIDPDLPLERWAAHWNDLKTYPSLTFETRHKARDGHTLPVEISANYFEYDGQGYNLGLVRDITERKQAEQDRLNHLRFFESMDRVNRAIQTTDDLEQMMRDALEAVFSIFDCDRAWLFYPCDPDAPSFRVPMEITKPEYPGAKIFNVDIPMPEDMAQNLREALESVGPVTYTAGTEKPINKVSADQFGVKSMMMVALYPKSGKPWAFGLHQCSYTRVWTQEDERLFQEIGRRLADALTSFLAYSSLQESEEKLSAAARIAHVGYWERDYSAESITLSEEACKIFGLPQNFRFPKLPEWHERWKILIHPDDRQKTTQAFADAMRGGPVYDIEYRVVWPNGDVRAVHSHGEVTRDESGRPRRVLGTMQDVTERKQQENVRLARLRLMEFAGSHTLEELLQAILNEAEALTNSNIGFYHFLQADQETISLQAWSTNTLRNMCTAEGKGLHYSVSAAGVWIDCIRERRAVIHNDYSALAHRKGLPPGHAPVARELVVPVFRANQIVAILGVGNKPYIYDEKDVSTVSLLADLAWDIADRKLSEQALAESEARFRQLYDEAPVAMYASNRGGEVVSINNKCLQELGRNREEVLGRPAEIFLSPDSMKRLPKVREAFWSEGRASNLSLQIVRKDGSTRDVIADSVALDDPCWGQVGFTVFRDITEQKLAEEALTQSEEFLRLIFANMNSGLLVLNCRQEIVLANDYARSCLAITDEMQDKPLLEILSNVEPLLTDAYPWEQRQIIITTPDGSRKVVAFNSTAAPDKDLRIVLFRDITMLLDNDERRKRAEQLAVVGELAAKLSHDIKNPLSSVFLGLQTLRKTESLSEDNRLTLDLVLEEVERLSENIRHVLEAARPLELSPSFLPLGEFLGWCFRIHSLTASNRGIQYELVPGPPDMFVMADETALRRIMTNLIQNAFDACGAGDHVRIGWRPIGDREKQTLAPEFPGSIVAIFVEDDGLAIPEDLQASALFRPFFTTKELGTGLGLAVVSDLVERHGGSIRLHSAGGLTLFEVLLPMGDRVPCWESLCTNACVPPNGEKDCANCEVRAQNAGLFCWVIRGRAVRAETGLWPNSCLTCPVFRATNLSYSFRGDIPTAEE